TIIFSWKYDLTRGYKIRPATSVGKKPTAIFEIRFLCLKRSVTYKKSTAKIAPLCIAISNVFEKSVGVFPRSLLAIIRCPVDETGRNSVIPSTIPSMIESNNVILFSKTKGAHCTLPQSPQFLREECV
ncbi:MAG: hypothetical protein QG563_125, partial [Patescibacteria group bacterium]|nr:hypothetical protein [Patescibacteria group bacterium]